MGVELSLQVERGGRLGDGIEWNSVRFPGRTPPHHPIPPSPPTRRVRRVRPCPPVSVRRTSGSTSSPARERASPASPSPGPPRRRARPSPPQARAAGPRPALPAFAPAAPARLGAVCRDVSSPPPLRRAAAAVRGALCRNGLPGLVPGAPPGYHGYPPSCGQPHGPHPGGPIVTQTVDHRTPHGRCRRRSGTARCSARPRPTPPAGPPLSRRAEKRPTPPAAADAQHGRRRHAPKAALTPRAWRLARSAQVLTGVTVTVSFAPARGAGRMWAVEGVRGSYGRALPPDPPPPTAPHISALRLHTDGTEPGSPAPCPLSRGRNSEWTGSVQAMLSASSPVFPAASGVRTPRPPSPPDTSFHSTQTERRGRSFSPSHLTPQSALAVRVVDAGAPDDATFPAMNGECAFSPTFFPRARSLLPPPACATRQSSIINHRHARARAQTRAEKNRPQAG